MNFKVDLSALNSDIKRLKNAKENFGTTMDNKVVTLDNASCSYFPNLINSINNEVNTIYNDYQKIISFLSEFENDINDLENELRSEFSNLKELEETKDIIKALNVSKITSASTSLRSNANNSYANQGYNQMYNESQLYSLFDESLDGSTLFKDAFPDLDISSFFEDLGIDLDGLDIDLALIEEMNLDDINNLVFNINGVNNINSIGSITSLNSNLGFNIINTNAISVNGINSLSSIASIGSAMAFDGIKDLSSIGGLNTKVNGIDNGVFNINSIDSIKNMEGITGSAIGTIDNSLLNIDGVGTVNGNISISGISINNSNIKGVGNLNIRGVSSGLGSISTNVSSVGNLNTNTSSGSIDPESLKVAGASLVSGAVGIGGIALASSIINKASGSSTSSNFNMNSGVSYDTNASSRGFFNESVLGGSSAPNISSEEKYINEKDVNPYDLTVAYIPSTSNDIYSLVTLSSNLDFIVNNSINYVNNNYRLTNSVIYNSNKLDISYKSSVYLDIILFLDRLSDSLLINNNYNNISVEDINKYKELLLDNINNSYVDKVLDDDIINYINNSFIYNFTGSILEDTKKINYLL